MTARAVIGYQRWDALLFLHWPVPREAVARLVDARLEVEAFGGRAWVSAGYAHDLKRRPTEDTRSEYPLGIGLDLISPRWQFGVAGQVVLRDDITAYTGALTGRLQF